MRLRVLLAVGVVAAVAAFATCAGSDEEPPPTDPSAPRGVVSPADVRESASRRRVAPSPEPAAASDRRADAVYAGKVIADEDETAIAGARVTLVEIDARDGSLDMAPCDVAELVSTSTGADGVFELRGRAGERLLLVASAAGRDRRIEHARPGFRHVIRLDAAERREVTVLAAEDRTPLAGARILVGWGFGSYVAAISGADGRAVFDASWKRKVFASASGRMTTVVPPGEGTVLLGKGSAVAGIVTAGGGAVAGARVAASAVNFAGPLPVQVALTGDDGRFAFDGFPDACEVDLGVSAPGFLDRSVNADAGDLDVVVRLSRSGTVRGVVLWSGGAPAGSSRIEVKCDPPQRTRTANSGAEGRFEVEAPADGDIEVVAQMHVRIDEEAYGLSIPAVVGRTSVSAKDRAAGKDVVIRLAEPVVSFVRLDAIDADGRRVVAEHLDALRRLSEQTDEGGRLSAAFALPGGSKVAARLHTKAGDDLAQPPFPVEFTTSADANAPPVTVRVPATALLRFAITSTDGRVPPADAQGMAILWELTPSGPAAVGSWMGAGAAGAKWRIAPGRRYRLKVGVQAFGVAVREFGAEDLADGPLAVRLDPQSRVRGRVVGADGRPAAGVVVTAGHGGGQGDANGAFDFAIADAGETRISVTIGLGTVWSEVRRLVPGETIDLGTIVATPAPTVEVRGVVRDEEDRPVGAATVWFRPPDQSLLAPSVRTGADGAFVITLTSPASGVLLATKRDHGAAWAAVDERTTTVAIRLAAPGRIRFPEVDDASTYGVRGPGGVTWWPRREVVRDVFGEPSVELYDVPPGRLVVFAETARGRIEREVDVVAGRTAEVVIE